MAGTQVNDPVARMQFGRVTVFFGDKSGKYPDGNQVVVRGSDTHAVFDTPLVANRIGPELDAAELVVLGHVHEDHMAGLHRLPRAQVQVHERDVEAARSWEGLARHFGIAPDRRDTMRERIEREFHYLPRPDAMGYADGASWELGGSTVRAIHMPGHTSGHSVLLVEPEGVAFIGDIDLSGFGPYYGDATSNLGEFRRSLERLPGIEAKVWVTSHHRGVYTEREQFLDALAAFGAKFEKRERRLLELLRSGPKTLAQLTDSRILYPADFDAPWVVDAERRTISQHLDELLAQQRVRKDADGTYRTV